MEFQLPILLKELKIEINKILYMYNEILLYFIGCISFKR